MNTETTLAFRMALQPIVDVTSGTTALSEALVRGANGEGAGAVFMQVPQTGKNQFDRACQWAAVQEFARGGQDGFLTVNVYPSSVQNLSDPLDAAFIQSALDCGFPLQRLVVEVSEGEAIEDWAQLRKMLDAWREMGVLIAFDDFCAAYSGLKFLGEYQPDIIKFDMAVTRNVDKDLGRQQLVKALMVICKQSGITAVAEGIETAEESQTLLELGIALQQGYFLQRPKVDIDQGLVFEERF